MWVQITPLTGLPPSSRSNISCHRRFVQGVELGIELGVDGIEPGFERVKPGRDGPFGLVEIIARDHSVRELVAESARHTLGLGRLEACRLELVRESRSVDHGRVHFPDPVEL